MIILNIQLLVKSVLSFIQIFYNHLIHLFNYCQFEQTLQPQKIISFSYSGFVGNVSLLWRKLPVELLPVLHVEGVILYGYTSSSLQEVALLFQWRPARFEVSLFLLHFPILSDQVIGLEGYQ